MSNTNCCEPCQKVLRGEVYFSIDDYHFNHHPDAESLKKALRLPCAICTLAFGKFSGDLQAQNGTMGHFDMDQTCTLALYLYDKNRQIYGEAIILVPQKNLRNHRPPDPLSSSSNSFSALEFIRRSLHECVEKHTICANPNSYSSFSPARIIDVGLDNDVQIRETQKLELQPYTCLSYCWGRADGLKLTKESESILRAGVSISSLPRTYQDAISVTRSLGFRYLWIDALCIYQDDDEDWSNEARHMSLIYSQAACTIAAASSDSCDGGLFCNRDPTTLRPQYVDLLETPPRQFFEDGTNLVPPLGQYWCDVQDPWARGIEDSTFASRGWICQERHLSARIIYFTKGEIFWECHESRKSELYPDGLPVWVPSWPQLKHKLRLLEKRSGTMASPRIGTLQRFSCFSGIQEKDKREIYLAWYRFRGDYSKCALTVDTDKLVAIQGVAEHVSTFLGDQLIAGLWRNNLLDDLCWVYQSVQRSDDEETKLTRWRAPTWSWASTDRFACRTMFANRHLHCTHKSDLAEICTVDVESRTSGEVKHATLTLRGRIITATFRGAEGSWDGEDVGVLTFSQLHTSAQKELFTGPGSGFRLSFDSGGHGELHGVHLLPIRGCLLHQWNRKNEDPEITCHEYDEDEIEGLILEPVSVRDNIYKRIGHFKVDVLHDDTPGLGFIEEEYRRREHTEVTLL